jgi:hypothetical protein
MFPTRVLAADQTPARATRRTDIGVGWRAGQARAAAAQHPRFSGIMVRMPRAVSVSHSSVPGLAPPAPGSRASVDA